MVKLNVYDINVIENMVDVLKMDDLLKFKKENIKVIFKVIYYGGKFV